MSNDDHTTQVLKLLEEWKKIPDELRTKIVSTDHELAELENIRKMQATFEAELRAFKISSSLEGTIKINQWFSGLTDDDVRLLRLIFKVDPAPKKSRAKRQKIPPSYSKCSRAEVENACNDMLARIGGGYNFYRWLEDKNIPKSVDFGAGFQVQNFQGNVVLQATSGFIFWDKVQVYTNTEVRYFENPPKPSEKESVYNGGELIYNDIRTIKDANILMQTWKESGINFLLYKAMSKITKL